MGFLILDDEPQRTAKYRIMRGDKTARERENGKAARRLQNKAYRKAVHHMERAFGKTGRASEWANGRAAEPRLFPNG